MVCHNHFFPCKNPSSSLSGGNHSRTRGKTYKKFDAIQAPKDPLEVPVGPVTRLRAKRFKEAFNELLQDTWAKVDFKRILSNEEQAMINLIHVQEGLVGETKHDGFKNRYSLEKDGKIYTLAL